MHKNSKVLRIKTQPRLPADFHWKLYTQILNDVECHVPVPFCLSAIRHAVRRRCPQALSQAVAHFDPQSIGLMIHDTRTIRVLSLLTTFLKKFQFPGDSSVRRSRAKDIFLECEAYCFAINRKLSQPSVTLSKRCQRVLSYARSYIEKVIGNFPWSHNWEYHSRHGPGSSQGAAGNKVSQYYKFDSLPYSVAPRCLHYARHLVGSDQRWLRAIYASYPELIVRNGLARKLFKVTPFNKVTFVPKDWKKDRPIAVEPVLNIYVQLGIEGVIRKRLSTFGINLNDQTRNRSLAQQGSIDSTYCTIDLSCASDLITTNLVRLLVPSRWFHILMDCRSPYGRLDDTLIEYQKISSMGNGYTFALQSLLFAAICHGVYRDSGERSRNFSVFGDDIIVRSEHYEGTVSCLQELGLRINEEKSFSAGPFRESCGGDYLRGYDVRGLYFKEPITQFSELFCLHNRLRGYFEDKLQWYVDYDMPSSLKYIRKFIPASLSHVVGPVTEAMSSHIHCSNFQSSYYYSINETPVREAGWRLCHPWMQLLNNRLRPVVELPFIKRKPTKNSVYDVVVRNRVRHKVKRVKV